MFNRIKTLFENLKQHNILESPVETHINPFQAFLDWLFETLQYGLAMTIVGLILAYKFKWLYILAFGLIRWLWLDIVGNTSKAIKKQ